jgi:transposase-like protein
MSKKGYRTYTQEFKLEALQLLVSCGKSAGQLERELGITPGLLLKWRDRYLAQTPDQPPPVIQPRTSGADKTRASSLAPDLWQPSDPCCLATPRVGLREKSGSSVDAHERDCRQKTVQTPSSDRPAPARSGACSQATGAGLLRFRAQS